MNLIYLYGKTFGIENTIPGMLYYGIIFNIRNFYYGEWKYLYIECCLLFYSDCKHFISTLFNLPYWSASICT